MIAPQDMRRAAYKVLSKERLQELTKPNKGRRQRGPVTNIHSSTNLPRSTPSGDVMDGNESSSRLNPEAASPSNRARGDATPVRSEFEISNEIDSISQRSQTGLDQNTPDDNEGFFSLNVDTLPSIELTSDSGGELVNPFVWG